MSFRFSTLCALVLVSAFLSQESAAAKNRHSLWSKVKSTFSSSTPSSTPRQSEAMAVRNAPVRHQMPAAAPTPPQRAPQGANTELFEIRRRANIISKVGLDYKFGGSSPSQGGGWIVRERCNTSFKAWVFRAFPGPATSSIRG